MIGLYKKIGGEVAFETFPEDKAEAALKDGWHDNPTDAENAKPKRGRPAKVKDADEA